VDVRRLTVLVYVLVAALWLPSLASAKDVTLTMDDGVRIDGALLLPDGTPPSGGWPAIMMFHGLGSTHNSLVSLAQNYVAKGYAAYLPDARGHGTSGGFVSLDGPREVADVRAEFQWLAALPEVSDTQIGVWGVSLGGGAAWNSVVARVPFKALATFQTWSDLYGALYPQNFAKSGAIYQFANSVPAARIDPALRPIVPELISGENLAAVRQFFGARSSLRLLSTVTTPSFLFQGRRDFAFDIDQAVNAYKRLTGPKRLYIGDFGHAPSTFPGPDLVHVLDLSTRWFDRFLKGEPNGVDKEKPVKVASDPWRSATAYGGPPAVKRSTFVGRARRSMTSQGKVVYSFGALPKAREQFGAPVVTVTATSPTNWPHLVAVLTAGQNVVSEGGTLTSFGRKAKRVSFRLIADATLIKPGQPLRLYLGGTSTVQSASNPLYIKLLPSGSRLPVTRVTLTIPFLAKTISR
jgi:predicted acyl esterase